MSQPKKRGRKPRPGVIRLYDHLADLVEREKYSTGWHTTDDICDFLFGAMTVKNLDKTRSAVGASRRMLKESHKKFFYFTETDGYVILTSAVQHREVIKRHAAISDGFRLSAKDIYKIGSLSLPELRTLLTSEQLLLLKNGTQKSTRSKSKSR